MANVDHAFGFLLVGPDLTGLEKLNIAVDNAAAIGIGDPVIGEADGYGARAAADSCSNSWYSRSYYRHKWKTTTLSPCYYSRYCLLSTC